MITLAAPELVHVFEVHQLESVLVRAAAAHHCVDLRQDYQHLNIWKLNIWTSEQNMASEKCEHLDIWTHLNLSNRTSEYEIVKKWCNIVAHGVGVALSSNGSEPPLEVDWSPGRNIFVLKLMIMEKKKLRKLWMRPDQDQAVLLPSSPVGICHICDDQLFQSSCLEWIFHFFFPFYRWIIVNNGNDGWWWILMDGLSMAKPFATDLAIQSQGSSQALAWLDQWGNRKTVFFFFQRSIVFWVRKQTSSFVEPVCQDTSSLRAVHCWE